MREFRKKEHRWALIKTIISCIGWGLLGYLVMTTYEGLRFWLGCGIYLISLCIGVVAADKLLEMW